MASQPRILVTGASGFVGRQALVPLVNLGFEVHGVSRQPISETVATTVTWHDANLLDAKAGQTLVESLRPTHLLHFAWYAEHGKFWDSPLNVDWLNSTLALLKSFAANGGKRFVGAGSCAEYDWSGNRFEEKSTPLRPSTLYGAAKASAFLTGAAFSQSSGLSFAWGRIFHLFGPGEPKDRIVPSLIRAHASGKSLDCSQGTQLRDFLPASAVGEAFAHLCAGDIGGAVNIGSGQGTTLRELSDRIAALAGNQAEIRFGAFHDAGPDRLVPFVERLTREAGWNPPPSLDAGLREAIAWWKARP